MLPGEGPKALAETLRKVVDDPNVTIEPLNKEFRVANFSPTDTDLYGAFRKIVAHYFPRTLVLPRLTSGYNEEQRYRPLGINAYGFNPYTATPEENNTEHGNDERIRVEEVQHGFQVLYDVVTSVAEAK
jgi:acetylornithine deacetylase/succinyl-diaminopimelate desuccinylase-like protein